MHWTEISLPGISQTEGQELMEILRSDPISLANTVVWYDPEGLVNSGRTQYFYHNPGSNLPVRDVNGRQGQGLKTEPHIECGGGFIAENLVKNCCQPSVRFSVMKGESYLFLVTRPRGPEMDFPGKLIVGYIANQGFGVKPDGSIFVFGQGHLVGFKDAVPFGELGMSHIRRGVVCVDVVKSQYIVDTLQDAANILDACARETVALTSNHQGHCSGRSNCFFRDTCLRFPEI